MTKKGKNKRPARLSDMKLRVMAEYCSSGVWAIGRIGPFRHGMIDHSDLGLPADLARRFGQWIELYDGRLAAEFPEYAHLGFDAEQFNQVGRALARELKAHVGPGGYVEFLPELAGGGLGVAEVIEDSAVIEDIG